MFAFKANLLPFESENFGFKLSYRSRDPIFIQEIVHLEHTRNFARFHILSEWNVLPISTRKRVCISKFKHLLFNQLLMNNFVPCS